MRPLDHSPRSLFDSETSRRDMDHATLKPPPSASDRGNVSSPTGGMPPASASALPQGARLREFEITGVIGEGGFSIVYAALDQRLGREVAIKEYIPASLARRADGYSVRVRSEQHEESFDAGLAGFMNEARLLAQFKHPALVEVLQFWEENGTAYMVMPRYHGSTLRQVLRERGARCDEAWLKRTLAPMLDVLELLHERSVFHRDIAPDNILIQRDDHAVLLDLGSAREILGDREQSVTVVVKPGYAPLEQYSGEFSLPQGPWTDVYAFGAVLHFAVTGAPPQASISRVMKDSRPQLADSPRPGFSEGFLRGIDAALALQPSARPQSAGELRALLAFDELPVATPDRASAERALDALHVDEAITAIVSAEEMADIAAQLVGASPLPAADAPAHAQSADPGTEAPQSSAATLLDPMAAASVVPDAPVFKDVEDLVSGKLLPSTTDVRVVSESRLEARIDTETAPAAARKAGWVPLALVASMVLVVAGAGGWWLLQPSPEEASVPPSVASGPANAREMERPNTDTRAPADTAAVAAGTAASPGPARDLGADATQSQHAQVGQSPSSTGEAAPARLAESARPQPNAAIPGELWATTPSNGDDASTISVESQRLALVDLSNASQQSFTADPAPVQAASPASSRRMPAAAELVSVRLSISPWAEVWNGSERKGVSPPLRELKLAPGRHRIELRNPAFPAKSVDVEVRAGENPVIEHRFSADGE